VVNKDIGLLLLSYAGLAAFFIFHVLFVVYFLFLNFCLSFLFMHVCCILFYFFSFKRLGRVKEYHNDHPYMIISELIPYSRGSSRFEFGKFKIFRLYYRFFSLSFQSYTLINLFYLFILWII